MTQDPAPPNRKDVDPRLIQDTIDAAFISIEQRDSYARERITNVSMLVCAETMAELPPSFNYSDAQLTSTYKRTIKEHLGAITKQVGLDPTEKNIIITEVERVTGRDPSARLQAIFDAQKENSERYSSLSAAGIKANFQDVSKSTRRKVTTVTDKVTKDLSELELSPPSLDYGVEIIIAKDEEHAKAINEIEACLVEELEDLKARIIKKQGDDIRYTTLQRKQTEAIEIINRETNKIISLRLNSPSVNDIIADFLASMRRHRLSSSEQSADEHTNYQKRHRPIEERFTEEVRKTVDTEFDPTLPRDERVKAYREAVKKFHPDKNPSLEAVECIRYLNERFETAEKEEKTKKLI